MKEPIRKNIYITPSSDSALFEIVSNLNEGVKLSNWIKERALIGELVLQGNYEPGKQTEGKPQEDLNPKEIHYVDEEKAESVISDALKNDILGDLSDFV